MLMNMTLLTKMTDDDGDDEDDDDEDDDEDDSSEKDKTDDNEDNEDMNRDDQSEHIEPRRSTRDKRFPERYGTYFSHQIKTVVDNEHLWKDKVDFLMSLLKTFPEKKEDIFYALLKVIV
jgi:hypothetical protein